MSLYTLYGALGSPYTLKVRAALRARRIPHVFVPLTAKNRAEVMRHVKVPVIPVLHTPEGEWLNDSTPILALLEERFADRSLMPPAGAARFAALLIEDYADEWLTKTMFHYRWARDVDADTMSKWLLFDSLPGAGRDEIENAAKGFRERQVSRMPIVGCTPENAKTIEDSANGVLASLQDAALKGPFLFGSRPSVADMAIFGQFSQLATDPTPQVMMREDYPYAYRWIAMTDDASGLEGSWADEPLNLPWVSDLMTRIGRDYLPFLAANASALEKGEPTFTVRIDGSDFSQGVFSYQAKCLSVLRSLHSSLDTSSQETIDGLLGPNFDVLRS